jgi:hypothetical protein
VLKRSPGKKFVPGAFSGEAIVSKFGEMNLEWQKYAFDGRCLASGRDMQGLERKSGVYTCL